MQRQVGGAEQAGQTRQIAGGVLHVRLLEDVEPPLERYDTVGVVVGFARVAHDETAGEFVEAAQPEHGGCFAPQPVPGGQPALEVSTSPVPVAKHLRDLAGPVPSVRAVG
jgi:hypothetical protein